MITNQVLNLKIEKTKKKLNTIKYNGKTIKIKQLIEPKIHLTNDLSIFRKYTYNRDTNVLGVNKIIKSIEDSCYIIPTIYVNKNMEVLRGQHTLITAKKLKAPVYYVISEDLTPEELVALETSKRWTDRDSLKAYADNGNRNALNILNYFDSINLSIKKDKKSKKTYSPITVPQLLSILYKESKYIAGIKSNGGISLLNKLPKYVKNSNLIKIVKIFSYIQKNCMPKNVTVRRQYISCAIIDFIFNDKKNEIDLNRLQNKMKYFTFHPEKNVKDYVIQLERHYF